MSENENLPVTVQNNNIVDVDTALEEWNAYQLLTQELLSDSDYHTKAGKKYKKKSAWRKYARAFRLSDEILEKEITRDNQGRVIEADFIVRVWSPDGRESIGWGNANKFEPRSSSNPNHDIPATAHTRAKNRAISDLIGAGEVSAEEISSNGSGDVVNNAKSRPKKPMRVTKRPAPKRDTSEVKEPENTVEAEVTRKTRKQMEKNGATTEKVIDYPTLTKENETIGLIVTEIEEKGLKLTNQEVLRTADKMYSDKTITPEEFKQVKDLLCVGK